MKFLALLFVAVGLAGCGSLTVPAAVQMDSGEALIGTTTAAIGGGHFEVASAKGILRCSGTYDALDARPELSVPVKCTDGRYGVVNVLRTPDGMAGSGTVTLSDGSRGRVAFGRLAGTVVSVPRESFNSSAPVEPNAVETAQTAPVTTYGDGSTACHSANYYGSLSCVTGLPRTTYVGGYFRKNGTYVHSYYRSHMYVPERQA